MSQSTADVDRSGAQTQAPADTPAEDAALRLRLPPELVERARPFDPPTALEEMRASAPVQRVRLLDGTGIWMVTGFAEARVVLSDPRFSADRLRGIAARTDIPEETRRRLLDDRARAGSFLVMDPPEHTRYRRLLTGQFTVRRMRELTPRVEQIVTDHLDAMLAGGDSADLVSAFALPVPSLVICELLGVPYADRAQFQQRSAALLRLDTKIEDVLRVRDELRDFMLRLVHDKRRAPQDDLLSGLIEQHGDDEPLTDDELVGISLLLLIAGHETTANMIGLGLFALLEHPDQLETLRARPELIPGAVEELLRHLSIVSIGVTRITTEPVRLGEVWIPAEETVMLSLPATNRDPAYWSEGASLDVTRERSPHLAFGHGVHQCLGQQLARVEMAVAFTHLLRRLPNVRLAVPAAAVPLRTDMAIYGVHALPITWDAPTPAR
jgi:cytochrome P450